MREEDIDDVLEVERMCFTPPWSREAFESELNRNDCAIYRVITCKGRVAAYGGVWKIVDEGHITNIAVHPSFRRMGFGGMILESLIDVCKAQGVKSMTLEVRTSNDPAISLYTKYGFKGEGVRKRYYQDNHEDALIMWKYDVQGNEE